MALRLISPISAKYKHTHFFSSPWYWITKGKKTVTTNSSICFKGHENIHTDIQTHIEIEKQRVAERQKKINVQSATIYIASFSARNRIWTSFVYLCSKCFNIHLMSRWSALSAEFRVFFFFHAHANTHTYHATRYTDKHTDISLSCTQIAVNLMCLRDFLLRDYFCNLVSLTWSCIPPLPSIALCTVWYLTV